MKLFQISAVLMAIFLFSSSFAAELSKSDVLKQKTQENCVAAAEAKYGSASVQSKAKKKKISRKTGYAYKMHVGDKNKRVNCFSDTKGKTRFYSGSI